MNQIPEEKILHHIEKGISQLTPANGEILWNQPAAPATGSEWYLDGTSRKSRRVPTGYAVLAACLVLCLTVTMLFQFMPTASVYLDVNPSVELKVNYSNRVTGAVPRNEDAKEILADMDLRGTDLDVALYAILGSMVHHGYLTQAQDTILISVYSPNTTRAASLEVRVSDTVTQTLDKMIQSGEVLTHRLHDEDLNQKDDDATPGKSAFIDELEDKYPQLEEADLDSLTVDEIISLLEQENLDYSDYKDSDEDDEDDEERDEDEEDEEEDDGEDDGEDDEDD